MFCQHICYLNFFLNYFGLLKLNKTTTPQRGNLELIKYLVEKGVDITSDIKMLLSKAAQVYEI